MTDWWEAQSDDATGLVDWLRSVAGDDAKDPGIVSTSRVADEIQDQLLGVVVDGQWRTWPERRQHNAGLHAETHGGRAMWWCRLGEHERAP